jgi:FHA domain
VILFVILVLAVGIVAFVSITRWRAGRRTTYTPIPLVFPMNKGIAWDATLAPPQVMAPPVQTVDPRVDSSFAPPSVSPPYRAVGDRSVEIPTSMDGDQVPATSETVRFVRPTDEVVQLLPGHLEVLSGDTRHQEIRFVRVAGQQPHLILGRNPGRSPQHVALNSSTVSRQHARLAFSGGKWMVANLSQTNPVVVNDQELTNLDGERQLADGDRIELGEVVLRFHAQ